MVDESQLDSKYFIDENIYNCPFCNRRHVSYTNHGSTPFHWSEDKGCDAWIVECDSCKGRSMHLTFEDLLPHQASNGWQDYHSFRRGIDLDSAFFYSVPTSFFVIDSRIPKIIRELIVEAEGCLKMNFLTGASACCRKAIYEFAILEKAEGQYYEDKIKSLKTKFPEVDPELFDVLCHIKDMTSDKIHEQSWDKWDSAHLALFLETLKAILHEVHVLPDEKKSRNLKVKDLLSKVSVEKQSE